MSKSAKEESYQKVMDGAEWEAPPKFRQALAYGVSGLALLTMVGGAVMTGIGMLFLTPFLFMFGGGLLKLVATYCEGGLAKVLAADESQPPPRALRPTSAHGATRTRGPLRAQPAA